MGAADFLHVAEGKTPREAFQQAIEEASYEYGHGGYSGTIAEKHSFVMITCPSGIDPHDYADQLMRNDDKRIRDKWGPAGCILVEKGYQNIPKLEANTAKVDNIPAKGTRQWVTRYVLYLKGNPIPGKSFDKKTDAIKNARLLSIRHKEEIQIYITKQLLKESPLVAVVKPNLKQVNEKIEHNKYLFFGWASS